MSLPPEVQVCPQALTLALLSSQAHIPPSLFPGKILGSTWKRELNRWPQRRMDMWETDRHRWTHLKKTEAEAGATLLLLPTVTTSPNHGN